MDRNKLFIALGEVSLFKIRVLLQFGTYRGFTVRLPKASVASVSNANRTEDDQEPSKHCSDDGQHHECNDLETRNGESLVYSRWLLEDVAVILKA